MQAIITPLIQCFNKYTYTMLRVVAEQIKIHRYHTLSGLYIISEQLTVHFISLVVVYNRKNITNIFTIHTLCASRGKN